MRILKGILRQTVPLYAVSIDQWDAVGCIAEAVYSDCFRHQGAKDWVPPAATEPRSMQPIILQGPAVARCVYRRAAWGQRCARLGMESTVIVDAGLMGCQGQVFGSRGHTGRNFETKEDLKAASSVEGNNIAVVCAMTCLPLVLRALGEYPGLDIDNRDTGRRLVKIAGYDDMPGRRQYSTRR